MPKLDLDSGRGSVRSARSISKGANSGLDSEEEEVDIPVTPHRPWKPKVPAFVPSADDREDEVFGWIVFENI